METAIGSKQDIDARAVVSEVKKEVEVELWAPVQM